MHGCCSPPVLLVNAEVDSMGGVGIACKTSPRRAAIERIQGELRQEYNVRDKTKRELEFLEKGGNPLDLLKPGDAASVSFQSTSFTNQHQDNIVTSEAKGSVAFAASPHGDSVESSGRLGANPCEPNSADNLMLFDGDHEFSEGDKRSLHPSRIKIVPSEKLSQMDGSHRTRERGEPAAFSVPRKAYKRRNRSRPNRDGIRLSSIDANTTHGSDGSSLPSCHGKDLPGLISDTENHNLLINCDAKPMCAKDVGNTGLVDTQKKMELGGGKALESCKNLLERAQVEAAADAIASETPLDDQCNQQSQLGALETPIQMTIDGSQAIETIEEITSVVIECQGVANKAENESRSCEITGISNEKDGSKVDAHNTTDLSGMKALDSESFCAQTNKNIDAYNDGDMNIMDPNGQPKDQILPSGGTSLVGNDDLVIEKRETGVVDGCPLDNPESSSTCLIEQENGFRCQNDEELNQNGSAMKSSVKNQIAIEAMEPLKPSGLESGIENVPALDGSPGLGYEIPCTIKNQPSVDSSTSDFPKGGYLTVKSTVPLDVPTSLCSNTKLQPEMDEDSILKEAEIIEAKRKRIAELSAVSYARKIHPKSHWDYVLEEMTWLANDFAQERVWKIAAAAQISCRAAFSCRLRKHESSSVMESKEVARSLAKSVMEFWNSVEAKSILPDQESQRNDRLPVKAYAVKILKCNNFNVTDHRTLVPLTPDRVSEMGNLDLSWEANLTEENLFYAVPPRAMETYKLSIESQVAQCEKISVQEEVETYARDATADFESQDTAYDEDDGEISPYDVPVTFDRRKPSRFGQNTRVGQTKRKHLRHAYGVRSYEVTSNILGMQYAENKVVNQKSTMMTKRPGGSLNVSIPTKRVRTASRRVISPFNAGASGIQVPNKADASSGDTNSFHDDQTTLRGGSFGPNSLEVESDGDFSKQLPFHSVEETKHKKKRPKHLQNAAYEPRWQVDTTFQMDQFQRDNLKKSHQLESNGNSGLFGQPMMKKPKIMRQSQDNSFENIAPATESAPSPVASQMSNMSTPNKFVKMLGSRDRGRKPKGLKMPTGQLGSGSPWTLFEDQALVVLAHDLGPNWELVSDAINSTLQFKCIFRKAKECKERHNFLMDRTSGDGADSAEDSGSSQPYPSTLPGIPKGSARQLFQRLQGPMEEETLKSHFEKIIIIGQKQQYRKSQNDNQDSRQLQQLHCSHTAALSQVCPNNLNGGPVLTPLDICDATISGPDILPMGYQGSNPGGLAIANQGPVTPMHSASGASSALQGSSKMMLGNNLSSAPSSLNSSMRDSRYIVPRPASADEQQRVQHYNHMMTNRSIPQSNLSPSGALPGTDRGVRIVPGGSAMGLAYNVNRSMSMARPGFQGIASSSMVNSGSMVSPGISSDMHTGVGSGQGSAMLRPREPMHMMRPGLSQDSQRPMMTPELQMQASPGNSPHFGALSSPFANQTVPPPVASYPLHHQPSHPVSPQQPQVLSPHHPHFQGATSHSPNPQQQAYAIRLAKERQHRLLQQQHQQQHPVQPQQPQFAPSSSLMPHVQSQPQLSTPTVQNSSQVQPPTATPPASLSPSTSASSLPQHQQKHQIPSQGVARNAQAGGSSKQRQRQQLLQANRQHPHQRQQPAKVAKGVARGSLMTHQNIPVDPSILNGVSTSPQNQSSDIGDTSTHLMSGPGSFANSTVQTTGQYASPRPPNQPLTQQKSSLGPLGQAPPSTKHLYQIPSHPESGSQGHVAAIPSCLSAAVSGSNHQQTSSHQKLVNQNQLALQRLQPNRQINSVPSKPKALNSDTGQHQTSSSVDLVVATTLSQTTSNASNVGKTVSSANSHQRHASEPLLDVHATSCTMSVPVNAGEPSTQVDEELGQTPSTSLPLSKHDVSAQIQQHPPSSQHPHPNTPMPQQPQLLQAGQGNLYGRPSDQSLE